MYVIKSHIYIDKESGVGIGIVCAACPVPLPPLFKCPMVLNHLIWNQRRSPNSSLTHDIVDSTHLLKHSFGEKLLYQLKYSETCLKDHLYPETTSL